MNHILRFSNAQDLKCHYIIPYARKIFIRKLIFFSMSTIVDDTASIDRHAIAKEREAPAKDEDRDTSSVLNWFLDDAL